jgi:hypothetical protein
LRTLQEEIFTRAFFRALGAFNTLGEVVLFFPVDGIEYRAVFVVFDLPRLGTNLLVSVCKTTHVVKESY